MLEIGLCIKKKNILKSTKKDQGIQLLVLMRPVESWKIGDRDLNWDFCIV